MIKRLQGSEVKAVRYVQHVLRNGSFYPITTFLMIACAVLAATWAHWITHTHAAVALGFVALALLMIADKRDSKIANESFEVQLEAVRDLISKSAALASAVATVRSDNQALSMHEQDVVIERIDTNTEKES